MNAIKITSSYRPSKKFTTYGEHTVLLKLSAHLYTLLQDYKNQIGETEDLAAIRELLYAALNSSSREDPAPIKRRKSPLTAQQRKEIRARIRKLQNDLYKAHLLIQDCNPTEYPEEYARRQEGAHKITREIVELESQLKGE